MNILKKEIDGILIPWLFLTYPDILDPGDSHKDNKTFPDVQDPDFSWFTAKAESLQVYEISGKGENNRTFEIAYGISDKWFTPRFSAFLKIITRIEQVFKTPKEFPRF